MVGRRSLIGLALALLCGMVSLPLAVADSPPSKDLASAERHWENGSKAYAARNWEAAAQAFRGLCEQHPQSPRTSVAYFYLGESYLQLKQPEKSHECYEKFLQQLPRHAFAKQAMFRRGEVAYLSGDHPGAQKSLHDFLAAYPKDGLAAFATVYLGEIELAAGRYGSALAWFTRAQEEFPNGPLATDCRFGSARANEEMKRYGEAELIYRELADDDQCPRRIEADYRLGMVRYAQQRYADAASSFAQHALRYPSSAHLLEARYWHARSETAQAHWDEAIRVLEDSVSTAAAHRLAPAIHFSLAEALRNAGKSDQALSHYAQVVASWPNSAWGDDSLELQVAIAVENNDHELAETLANDFHERYPLSPLRGRVDQSLARSHLVQRKFAEARELLEPLANSVSSTVTAEQRWWNQFYLARAEYGLEHHEAAEQLLTQLATSPLDDQQRTALSMLEFGYWYARGDYARAIGLLQGHVDASEDRNLRVRCLAQIALSQAKQGAWPAVGESLTQLEEVLPLSHSAANALELLTAVARQEKQDEIVKRSAGLLVDHAPAADAALLIVARNYYELQKFQDARGALDRFFREHPHSARYAEALLLSGQLFFTQRQYGAAAAEYRRIADEHDHAEQVPLALLALARTYRTQQEFANAKRVYEQWLEKFPSHEKCDEAIYHLGSILHETGEAEASQELFERLTEQLPDSRYGSNARYRLAEQAYQRRDWQQFDQLVEPLLDPANKNSPTKTTATKTTATKTTATKTTATNPVHGHALQMAMLSHAAREQWDRVELRARELRDHQNAELAIPARYWLAESLYRRGRYRESVVEWQSLASELLEKKHSLRGATLLRQAQTLAQLHRWEEVYPVLDQLESTMPEFRRRHEADYLRGRSRFEQGQYVEARKHLEQVVLSAVGGRSETAAISQWLIGESLMRERQFPAAIAAFQRVQLYDYPTWKSAALLQEGRCCELSGEKSQGIQRYARLLKEAPESQYAQEASRRLNTAQAKTPVRK